MVAVGGLGESRVRLFGRYTESPQIDKEVEDRMNTIAAIAINTEDNVATAVADIEANTKVSIKVGEGVRRIIVKQPVPFGHKFALVQLLGAGQYR